MKTVMQMVESCQEKTKDLIEMISIKSNTNRLEEIDHLIGSGNLWSDPQNAVSLMKERQKLSDLLSKINYFQEQTSFYKECLDTIPLELEQMAVQISSLEEELIDFEFKQIMSDPVDNTPAILTISAGAGGLEAANWVTMLLRMYCRYADSYKLNVEILDMKPSEEHSSICTDSVTIRIDGPYAYGFLKMESGIFRLIRNSPFNSGNARHTSFAAISVEADIEDNIEIKIEDKDIDITAQAAGGPGGQNVNAVNSACRIKHIPSGINILVRSERDFHKNKSTAMKMLKAKLYNIEMKKKQELLDEKLGALSTAAFGNQIKTMTMSPYQLVKDHRTEYETNNVDSILDGEIHEFLLYNLRWNK